MTRQSRNRGSRLGAATFFVTTSLGSGMAIAGTAADGSESVALEEIVVTAEKRSASIQEVPAAVSAIQGAELQTQGLKSLADYAQNVAGLSVIPNGSPGQSTIAVRGIAPIG